MFLARDRKHDRQVAMKVLRPEFAASVGGDRFLKEIGIAAKMTHPHILPLFDSGQVDGVLYYVMPFVEGETLRDRIKAEGRLPIADAIQLTGQVSDALSYAHRNGVVHRDIKPENILLADGKAVVADFGIARAMAATEGEALTATGVAIGTPQYMSPEQSSGDQELDGRTDIYSLGCVLFEMLVGRPPFSGRRAPEVLAQHLSKAPPSPMAERKEVPVWLDRLVLKMLAKDPERRFDTAEVLSAEIGGHVGSDLDSITDPWMRWVYRTSRHRRLLLMGAVGIALAGVGYWLTGPNGGGDPGPIRSSPYPVTNVGIIPLEDLSVESSGQLGRMVTDYLQKYLDDIPQLSLVSGANMREFQRLGTPLDSIVEIHQLGTLIEGHVTATAGEMEVFLALIDGSSLLQIGSVGPRIRRREESIGLLNEIAEEVTELLRRPLGIQVTKREIEAGTDCAECLELYSQAVVLLEQARPLVMDGDTAAGRLVLAHADSLLTLVEGMDRQWSEPSIERGWVQVERSRLFGLSGNDYDTLCCHQGILHADRALDREPGSFRALELRGILRSYLADETADAGEKSHRWEEAQQDLEAALQREPNLAGALARLSYIHRENGDFELAKQTAERALAADAWYFHDENIVYRL
ncbi:MAG: protein kinase, partial [Longimicrobiales bacterium]|nr:protein kinase [Longimicrobiales bacterium]